MKVIPIEEFRQMLDELPDKEAKVAVISDEEAQKVWDELPDKEREHWKGVTAFLIKVIAEGPQPLDEEEIDRVLGRDS